MRISEHRGARLQRGHLAAAAFALAALMPAGPAAAQALDSPVMQFHSYEPARPRLKADVFSGLSFWKGDLEKAREAWRAGKFAKARKAFERAWKKGNIVAAWYLGHIYRLGRGVRANDEKAFRYYRQVALTYDPDESNRKRLMMTVDALVRVADYYRTGIGKARKKRDPRRAYRLYNIAAGHGSPAAFYGLGVITLKGQGMKNHPRRAINWLMMAAKGGYAPAAALLGDLAARGLKSYIRKDRIAAMSWYFVAASLTSPALSPRIYDRLEALQARATDKERARARQLAARFTTSIRNKPRAITAAQ